MNKISILVGADICPTKNNISFFSSGDINTIIGDELSTILQKADFRIFNLETPLTEELNPIDKCGPNLSTPKNCIKGIKMLDPSLLSLANNHTIDQGEKGLLDTVNILEQYKIPFVGLSKNYYFLEKNDIKIGIFVCAEHEWCIESSFFDPLETPDNIYDLKKKCDYVIVLYHGGKENYRYPSPLLQKRFRKIAEKGADIVIAQHTHCVGCQEKYNNSILIYGQGNFIFNLRQDEYWNNALLLNIIFTKDNFYIEYIPIFQTKYGTKLAKDEIKEFIIKNFNERSLNILNKNFIENKYYEFAKSMNGFYLDRLQGNSFLHRIFYKLFRINISKYYYSKKKLLILQNFVECEAHRELLLRGIK